MSTKFKILSVLLIVGHILTEAHSILYQIYPQTYFVEMDLFFSSTYHNAINLLWYLKMNTEDILWIITFYVLSQAAKEVSRAFFNVCCVFLFYHMADFFFFMWNFKDTAEIYWVLLACTTMAVWLIISNRNKLKAV